jgi:hypothetical protein
MSKNFRKLFENFSISISCLHSLNTKNPNIHSTNVIILQKHPSFLIILIRQHTHKIFLHFYRFFPCKFSTKINKFGSILQKYCVCFSFRFGIESRNKHPAKERQRKNKLESTHTHISYINITKTSDNPVRKRCCFCSSVVGFFPSCGHLNGRFIIFIYIYITEPRIHHLALFELYWNRRAHKKKQIVGFSQTKRLSKRP